MPHTTIAWKHALKRLPALLLALLGGFTASTVGGQDIFVNPAFLTSVGVDPLAVANGDFSRDGRQDLVVANALSNDLSILLGTGDGSFGSQTRLTVGTFPYSVAVGDFNGDGAADLSVANLDSNDLSILLGVGDGTFGPETRVGGLDSPFFVAVGEFNGDGHQDLAVTDFSDAVRILLGAGDGTFTQVGRFATGRDPRSIAVGDFNADGIQDLAVADYGAPLSPPGTQLPGEISVLLGLGDGSFGPEARYTAGFYPFSVAIGDFNRDGRQDLAVANDSPLTGEISLLLGTGGGQFAPKTGIAVPAGALANHVAVGDFNGDGLEDLAVAERGSNDVLVLLGAGDGNFPARVRAGAGDGAFFLTLSDFNDDGLTDLAVVGSRSNDLRVLPGRGDGSFGPRTRAAVGDAPDAIALGDVNGDGRADLVTANLATDDVSVLLGIGDGTYAPETRLPAGHAPVSVAVADLNADALPDIVVANSLSMDVSILLGLPGGGFAAQTRFPAGGALNNPRSVTVGDFNGDGRADLAVANGGSVFLQRGFVSILMGAGDGTFSPQATFEASANPDFLTTGDFNDDGRIDLVVADLGPGDPFPAPDVLVLLGSGTGAFGPPNGIATGNNAPRSIVVGDFNGDGRQDLAVARTSRNAPATSPSEVSVMLGRGDGTFGPETHMPTTLGSNSVVASDFDQDGRQDLAVANLVDNTLSLLLGLGDGTFGPQLLIPAGSQPAALAVGDVNGDRAPDLEVVNRGSDDVWVVLNTFLPLRVFDISISSSSPLGRGSGTVSWTTDREMDLRGFNVILLDSMGQRTPLNVVLIPCEECVTGGGHTYTLFVPKHKSGKNIFIEAVHVSGRIEVFGPAVRQ